MENNWKCEKCGKSYYSDSLGTTTLMYYKPIYKDGVNINPDKNVTSFRRSCIGCGAQYKGKRGHNFEEFTLQAPQGTGQ